VKVVVFGLGYVGTVTASCLAAPDRTIVGVDPDVMKVDLVRSARSPVVEPGLDELLAAGVRRGWITATTSAAEALVGADVALLSVGTPSNADGSVDLRYVERAAREIAEFLRDTDRFLTVVVRSTVPPGTVEQVVVPALEHASGRRVGREIGVGMCPEFLREGSGIADFFDPPFVAVGAADERVAAALTEMFRDVHRPVRVMPIRVAEGLKYACNAFHAVKISFVNEIGRLCRSVGIDSRALMAVFNEDDRLNISTAYLRPGFAYGGPCLPKDLRALQHLARQANVDTPLLVGTSATNDGMIRTTARELVDLATRDVALLGLSFKPETDDLRESPYVELAEMLIGKGIELRIYDPIVHPDALFGANRRYVEDRLPHLHRLLVPTPEAALAGAGAAVVASPHAEVVKALLASPPAVVVDLVGRLGAEVEALDGYRGSCW
jgi:GDP-mannose 6-dehydrogenase